MGQHGVVGIRGAAGTVLLLSLLVGACGGDDEPGPSAGAGAATDDGVVPFASRPAELPEEPTEQVAGPEVADCTTADVTFEALTQEDVLGSEPGGDPIGGPGLRSPALMARPGVSCALVEWPTLRLAASTGDPGPLVPDAGVTSGPPGDRLLLTGRQRVLGIVRWDSSCLPAGAEVRVEAVLAGGDVVGAPLGEAPACDPAVANTTGPWMVFPAPAPESPLTVTVDEPEAPEPGGTLAFTVTLANGGEEPVPLDPCPIYWVSYGESGTAVFLTNELNCDEAPAEVGLGEDLRFAVEMELPADEIPAGFVGSLFFRIILGDASESFAENVPIVEARS